MNNVDGRAAVERARAALPPVASRVEMVDRQLLQRVAAPMREQVSGRGWDQIIDVAVICALLNGVERVGEVEIAEAVHLTGRR